MSQLSFQNRNYRPKIIYEILSKFKWFTGIILTSVIIFLKSKHLWMVPLTTTENGTSTVSTSKPELNQKNIGNSCNMQGIVYGNLLNTEMTITVYVHHMQTSTISLGHLFHRWRVKSRFRLDSAFATFSASEENSKKIRNSKINDIVTNKKGFHRFETDVIMS